MVLTPNSRRASGKLRISAPQDTCQIEGMGATWYWKWAVVVTLCLQTPEGYLGIKGSFVVPHGCTAEPAPEPAPGLGAPRGLIWARASGNFPVLRGTSCLLLFRNRNVVCGVGGVTERADLDPTGLHRKRSCLEISGTQETHQKHAMSVAPVRKVRFLGL